MSTALRDLERVKGAYGPGCARRKLALLRVVARQRLSSAAAVERLHETLCFLRAYPDDAEVLAKVESLLAAFSRRKDIARYRDALDDSGIAGTTTRYRFFWPTARWLARRWPERLTLDPDDEQAWERIGTALPLLVTRGQREALLELRLPPRDALSRVKAQRGRSAAFLVERIDALPGDDFTREALHDGIDATYVFRPGPDTPSRTLAKERSPEVVFQANVIRRDRPDLRTELLRRPASVRFASSGEGRRLVELARGAMITRQRDLDAFAYGDPRDVRIVDDGGGLTFIAIGVVPERRALLPAIYGYVTLRNGVPIGYVQTDAIDRWAAVSFNTFDTYRGGEAAFVFARVLAMTRHLFGATSFTIEPYQLGSGNAEGIASGAFWFYYKMGFRPRDPEVKRVLARELARLKGNPRHRSSASVLEALASRHVFFDLDRKRTGGLPPLAEIGLAAGGDPKAASRDGMRRLGIASLKGWSAGERIAWSAWAPLLSRWSGIEKWPVARRRALVRVIRAKGGRRESDYVALFAAHPRLSKLIRSAGRGPRRPRG